MNDDDGVRYVVAGGREHSFQSTGDPVEDGKIAQRILAEHGHKPMTRAETMHAHAAGFMEAARLVHNEVLQKEVRGRARGLGAAPFVVNASFALEIYLKSIYAYLGASPPRDHDLGRLLNEIPEAGRSAIQMQIPGFWTGEAARDSYDLAEIVSGLAGAFVGWRYYYEGSGKAPTVHIGKAIYALQVLHAASRALIYGQR